MTRNKENWKDATPPQNTKISIITLAILGIILMLNIYTYEYYTPSEYEYVDIVPEVIIYNESAKINISLISLPDEIDYEREFNIYVHIANDDWSNKTIIIEGTPNLVIAPFCPFGDRNETTITNNSTSVVALSYWIDDEYSNYEINNTLSSAILLYDKHNGTSSRFPIYQVSFTLEVQETPYYILAIDIIGTLTLLLCLISYVWHDRKKRLQKE